MARGPRNGKRGTLQVNARTALVFGAIMIEPAVIIDTLEFARSGQGLEGKIEVAALERLADSLFDNVGTLAFDIRGGYDARQRPHLKLRVDGEISLQCQRCLGRLRYSVSVGSTLLVLTPGASSEADEIDDLDGVPADPHTDVRALVEDEVLLAVPYAPRHPEGQCSTLVKAGEDRAASPFAVLARLKQDQIEN